MPKTRQSASDDEDDALALRLVALLNDDQVLAKLKSVLYPRELYDKIAAFTDRVTSLTVDLAAKDAKIEELTTRVESLEAEADRQEQYSRRPNLRFQGVPESTEGSTDQKIVSLVNECMGLSPPLAVSDIERSHRLGPPKDRDGRDRTRPVIVRFRSERLRDTVYRARTKLKSHNLQQQPDARIFVNEDLTARRATSAFLARQAKKSKKITDSWTADGKVLIKDLANNILQITSHKDLAKY